MSENLYNSTQGDLSFSISNDLEWNQKKQDMILNLGLTNSNSGTDQTPTPTRFIRNCEEVGLFQDLQNVNPFDEVFKKAVEDPLSITHSATAPSSDDTLHTPQIFPSLEDPNQKFQSNNNLSSPCELPFSSVISDIEPTQQGADDGDNPLVINLDAEIDVPQSMSVKKKIKESLLSKQTIQITPVCTDKLLDKSKDDNSNRIGVSVNDLLRQREANRAAQNRCRKRKKQEFQDLQLQNKNLREENFKLRLINATLQETIKKLQENGCDSIKTQTVTRINSQISAISINKVPVKKHLVPKPAGNVNYYMPVAKDSVIVLCPPVPQESQPFQVNSDKSKFREHLVNKRKVKR